MSVSLNAVAEVKVDFDNLPYVENYWLLSAKEIGERAYAGDPFAQRVLSLLHQFGSNGYLMDEELEKSWKEKAMVGFEKLATQGHAAAQYELGVLYSVGKRKDSGKAITYLKQAADQGYALAQFRLAEIYRKEGDVADPELATYWYKQAFPGLEKGAQEGLHPNFVAHLSMMYKDGLGGLEQDAQKFDYWNSKYVENRRNFLASYQDHVYNPVWAYVLTAIYIKQFDDGKADVSVLYKAYTLARLTDSQSEIFEDIMERTREDILQKGQLDKDELDKFAKTCLQNLTEACY